MRFFATIGVLAVLAVLGAGVFLLGGFFSVAATYEEPGVVKWALAEVREVSVRSQARAMAPRPTGSGMDDPALVRQGAAAFLARGCANCHGAPGVEWAKFSEGLNPGPADLGEISKEREAREIAWVALNGIRMTGMPGFAATGMTADEAWAIAAFVKKLPGVSEAEFREWTGK